MARLKEVMGKASEAMYNGTNAKLEVEFGVDDPYKGKDDIARKRPVAFPDDITSIDSAHVMKLLTEYEGEAAYLSTLLAQMQLKLKQSSAIVRAFKRKIFLDFRKLKVSVPDATAAADCHEEVVEAETELMSIEAARDILLTRYDIYVKYAGMLSREITRRKSESFKITTPVDPGFHMQTDRKQEIIDSVRGAGVKDSRGLSSDLKRRSKK